MQDLKIFGIGICICLSLFFGWIINTNSEILPHMTLFYASSIIFVSLLASALVNNLRIFDYLTSDLQGTFLWSIIILGVFFCFLSKETSLQNNIILILAAGSSIGLYRKYFCVD